MMNVRLKFLGVGYRDICQAHVCIFDECNNLICEKTTYNGEIIVCLCCGRLYKIKAKFMGEVITGAFYVSGYNNVYVFNFSNSIARVQPSEEEITFLLTDYYYEDLPIERGDLILWQR